MNRTVVRSALAAVATTAVLLTSACSSDEPEETTEVEATEGTGSADAETEEPAEAEGPVEVPDVTLLILATAQDNLGRVGLEAVAVDEAGAEVTVEDPTTYLVTAQDPEDGELEAGETVTLTVAPRG